MRAGQGRSNFIRLEPDRTQRGRAPDKVRVRPTRTPWAPSPKDVVVVNDRASTLRCLTTPPPTEFAQNANTLECGPAASTSSVPLMREKIRSPLKPSKYSNSDNEYSCGQTPNTRPENYVLVYSVVGEHQTEKRFQTSLLASYRRDGVEINWILSPIGSRFRLRTDYFW